MTETRQTAVFARLGSRPIPRVIRMMRVTESLGAKPIFCGALRDEGLLREDNWDGWDVVRLGEPFPLLNGTRPWLYVKSVFQYNLQLFKFLRKSRPRLVHASDFETMPAAVLFRLLSRSRLIYNIHDNLAQRYNIPAAAAFLLNILEGINVLFADVTLVPEDFRRSALPRWCQRKVDIVRNTPEDCEYAEPDLNGREALEIFFGGWLDWGRGLGALLELAENNPEIALRVAGEGAPEIVAALQANPRVHYLGFLDHQAVMEETRRCHFISALYDPVRTINRFAASNKLAEALAVGRPVILNCEMLIAESLGPSPCLIIEKYSDIVSLAPRLRALVADEDAFRDASIDARRIYEDRFAWGPVREKIESIVARQLDK